MATARRLCLAALLCAGGCGSDTTLLLQLSLAAGVAQPDHVRISLYGDGLYGTPSTLPITAAGKQLPGTVFVGPLASSTPDFRLQVDGLDAAGALGSQAATRPRLASGQQQAVALILDRPTADTDGDGVPDSIDDCSAIPDPDQRCGAPGVDGAGAGDLPPGVDLLQTHDGGALPCPAGAIFCDDFESGAIGKWTTTDTNGGKGQVAVSQTVAFRGAFSLSASTAANLAADGGFSSVSGYVEKDFTQLSPATLAARVYLYAPAAPGNFAVFMALFEQLNGFAVGTDNLNRYVVTQDQGNNPDQHSTVPLPLNRWVCVELVVDFSSVATPLGRVQLFSDSQPVLDFQPSVPTLANEFDVGMLRSPGDVPVELFFDDVVLATQRIGCE